MEDMRGLRGQIQQHIDSMNETFQKLLSDNIKNSSARIDELQQRIAKINADMASLSPQISSINSDLMNQEHTKRVVRDNVELRKARKDLEAAQVALQSLREKKGLDERLYSESQRDLQRAEQERNRAASEKATLAGKIEIYQEQLKDIKAKLNGPNYREVGTKHRRISIQYETTELAVRDLDSYYNALYVLPRCIPSPYSCLYFLLIFSPPRLPPPLPPASSQRQGPAELPLAQNSRDQQDHPGAVAANLQGPGH